jgi:hypothetical protein
MAGRTVQVNIDLVPLDVDGDTASPAWVRATEILLRIKSRRDAALPGTNGKSDDSHNDGTQYNLSI